MSMFFSIRDFFVGQTDLINLELITLHYLLM